MKRNIILLVAAIGATALAATPSITSAEPDDKVTICHATGSGSNPFVQITVSERAVDTEAKADHNTDQHQNGEDIIPPGSYDPDGRNFTPENAAILENGCQPVVTTTTTGPATTIPGTTTTVPATTIPGTTTTVPATTIPATTVPATTTTVSGGTIATVPATTTTVPGGTTATVPATITTVPGGTTATVPATTTTVPGGTTATVPATTPTVPTSETPTNEPGNQPVFKLPETK